MLAQLPSCSPIVRQPEMAHLRVAACLHRRTGPSAFARAKKAETRAEHKPGLNQHLPEASALVNPAFRHKCRCSVFAHSERGIGNDVRPARNKAIGGLFPCAIRRGLSPEQTSRRL